MVRVHAVVIVLFGAVMYWAGIQKGKEDKDKHDPADGQICPV